MAGTASRATTTRKPETTASNTRRRGSGHALFIPSAASARAGSGSRRGGRWTAPVLLCILAPPGGGDGGTAAVDRVRRSCVAEFSGRRAEILAVIAEEASIDPTIIDAETSVADLGIGSLDMVELIFKIEERFGIEVPSQGVLESNDVKVFALLEAVEQLIDARSGKVSTAQPAR
ncbi:acyl carrier protein [Xanthobacter sp.]|uniref:acyl carrier protein n=1 Tax=Xanthobacter sp. TaxID=35809 RepID=UPI0035B11BC8